jgi:hypothetical protein
MKNKNNSPNDIQIYLNSIKQGKIFLENSKKKNIELQKTIKDLEEQKNSLEYKLVEANQKIKRFESDYKVNDNKDNKNENNDQNKNSNTYPNNEIINLKNKIDDYEISNNKLKLDNKNLEDKIKKMEQEHNNRIKLITNYKNSELNAFHKVINGYKEYFRNHNLNPNISTNQNENSNNNRIDNNNNNLDYGKIIMEMSNRDKIIKSLNTKLDKYMTEYKEIIDENKISHHKINQLQFQVEKLVNEKKNLMEQNQNLKMEISKLNQHIEMEKTKYKNKKYINNKNILDMQNKLNEYKQKVITLKIKIKELLNYKQQQQNINIRQNDNMGNQGNMPNFNNFMDIKNINLTPTQKKKVSALNKGNNQINKMSEKGSKYGNNKFMGNTQNNMNNYY